jgi:hypothetical protein
MCSNNASPSWERGAGRNEPEKNLAPLSSGATCCCHVKRSRVIVELFFFFVWRKSLWVVDWCNGEGFAESGCNWIHFGFYKFISVALRFISVLKYRSCCCCCCESKALINLTILICLFNCLHWGWSRFSVPTAGDCQMLDDDNTSLIIRTCM